MLQTRIGRHGWRHVFCFLPLLVAGTPALASGVAAARAAEPGQATLLSHVGLHASAATGSRGAVRFDSLGWASQTLTGANPTFDLYLPGPGDVAFGSGTTLSLTYSRSPLVGPQNSWLSMVMNNVNVGAYLLTGGSTGSTTLTVRIPSAALIGNGFNHLQLMLALREQAQPGTCADDPALSVTIYGSSVLRYDVKRLIEPTFNPDLALLPAPFVSAESSIPAQITVGLPSKATATELTALGWVLARFGEDAPARPPTVVAAVPETLLRQHVYTNMVLIGTPRDNAAIARFAWPASLRLAGTMWRDGQGQALPPDEGIILEVANPWDHHRTALVLSGNGQEGIRRAAMMVSSAVLRSLLHGTMALLPRAPVVPFIYRPTNGTATLSALGYNPATVQGSGEHIAQFSFDLTQPPAKSGQFTLVYGHASTLNAATSSIRVDLNNQPLASRQLAASDPPRIRWQLALPLDQLQLGTNVVTVHFFLSAPGAACMSPPYSSIWAVVDPSSNLNFPMTQGTGQPDLSLLPFPLLIAGDPRRTVLVVPTPGSTMTTALNLAVLLGTQSRVDAPQPTVLTADQATAGQLRGHTVVLDGLPPTDPFVARLQDLLPLQIDSGGLQLTGQATTLQAAVSEQNAVGSIEELPSPWDATQTAVLVSSAKPALLLPTQQVLFSGRLNGIVATVDAAGRVQTLDTRTPQEKAAADRLADRPIRALTFMGIGLLLIVFAFSVIRWLRDEGRLL